MPQHIEQRRRLWYAVLDIPQDLQDSFGKKRHVKSLETDSRATALRRSAPLIASWKAEFQATRLGSNDTVDQDIKFLREALSNAETHSDEDGEFSERDLLIDSIRDKSLQMNSSGSEFYRRAIGELVGTVEHLNDWIENIDVTDKTKDMNRSDINRLSQVFPATKNITRKEVNLWTQRLVKEESLTPKTVARIVSACRGYWRYLQDIEVVASDLEPFQRLEVASRAKRKTSPKDQRRAFEASEVVTLRKAANDKGDDALADLINLGMWTGCRIEELCSLTVANVKGDFIEIEDAKTSAGWRQVPIHSKLKDAIATLTSESDDGFVVSGLTPNKYGDRSNAIGKRFGRLKKAMGYDGRFVFHSIRKTVATLLENAGVPENVAADIIGHDKPTMTYGTYSGGLSLEVKREALEKIDYSSQ